MEKKRDIWWDEPLQKSRERKMKEIKKQITLQVTDTIWNELILFNQEQLNEYVSKAVKEQVKRDMK